MQFTRYAIFYTPAPGPLASFGAAWLGWDPVAGRVPPRPDLPDLPVPWEETTRAPRNYGFHGTLKPPFYLAEGRCEDDLRDRIREFCSTRLPVRLRAMELAQLGRFLALVPVEEANNLNSLANDTVRTFDEFRAPLSNCELTRRQQRHLTERQNALLREWGYPYVMEEFRFHLTLTGKLPKAKATGLRSVLTPLLAALTPIPFVIDAVSLMGEDERGRFHLIERAPLSAGR